MSVYEVSYDLKNKATSVIQHQCSSVYAGSEAAAKALVRKHLYYMRGWPLRKNIVMNMTAVRISN